MIQPFAFVLAAAASVLVPDMPDTMAGTWDMKAGDTIIFRLHISQDAKAPTATWDRPEHFETDGENFSSIRGQPVRRTASGVRMAKGDIELRFDDPAPHSRPDVFRLHRVDATHLRVTYENFEPFDFVRAAPETEKLGPWDQGRTYVRPIARSTSAEMTAIFEADQNDRKAEKIDWSQVSAADGRRRARTQELLDSDALQSGEDFYHAAFVFQHGDLADDILKAHVLATIAVARGKPAAVWIASATLDRYLQRIGQPQVLGTQFRLPEGGPVTQEPYDKALIPDSMRKALHVPGLAEQEQQRLRLQARNDGAKQP